MYATVEFACVELFNLNSPANVLPGVVIELNVYLNVIAPLPPRKPWSPLRP